MWKMRVGRDVDVEGESVEGMWVWKVRVRRSVGVEGESGEESVETGEGCRCGV